jgi:hypothetical protein
MDMVRLIDIKLKHRMELTDEEKEIKITFLEFQKQIKINELRDRLKSVGRLMNETFNPCCLLFTSCYDMVDNETFVMDCCRQRRANLCQRGLQTTTRTLRGKCIWRR